MNITTYRPSIYARARRIEAEGGMKVAAGSTDQEFARSASAIGAGLVSTRSSDLSPAPPSRPAAPVRALSLAAVAGGSAL